MKYIDGFLIPVPKKKLDEYKNSLARRGRSGWNMARWIMWNVLPTT